MPPSDLISPSHELLGVVLCGGRSSRMGRDKSQLPHSAGSTFLQHAVHRLSDLCAEVCLAGDSAAADAVNARRIPDPVPHRGPATGIAAALTHASQTGRAGCLVTPVDTPHLTAAGLMRLIEGWRKDPSTIACAMDPDRQQLQPLIAIYPVRWKDAIEQLSRSEDRSLQRWLKTQPHQSVPLPAASLYNINRPEDLKHAP